MEKTGLPIPLGLIVAHYRVGNDGFTDIRDGIRQSTREAVNHPADVAAVNFHVGGHLARRDHAETIIVPSAPFERQPTAFCVLKGHHGDLLSAFDSGAPSRRACSPSRAARW